MEHRLKKKRRSSILKSRKSLADVDSNATLDVAQPDEERKGLKRRVSFCPHYTVKEITRVADIHEKWPEDTSSEIDTANINEVSNLSRSIPKKKLGLDPDPSSLSSLLSAPLVVPTSSTAMVHESREVDIPETLNQTDGSNMDFTMVCPKNPADPAPQPTSTVPPILIVKEQLVEDNLSFPFDYLGNSPLKVPPCRSLPTSEAKEKELEPQEEYSPLDSPTDVLEQPVQVPMFLLNPNSPDALPLKDSPAGGNFSSDSYSDMLQNPTVDSSSSPQGNPDIDRMDNTVFLDESMHMTIQLSPKQRATVNLKHYSASSQVGFQKTGPQEKVCRKSISFQSNNLNGKSPLCEVQQSSFPGTHNVSMNFNSSNSGIQDMEVTCKVMPVQPLNDQLQSQIHGSEESVQKSVAPPSWLSHASSQQNATKQNNAEQDKNISSFVLENNKNGKESGSLFNGGLQMENAHISSSSNLKQHNVVPLSSNVQQFSDMNRAANPGNDELEFTCILSNKTPVSRNADDHLPMPETTNSSNKTLLVEDEVELTCMLIDQNRVTRSMRRSLELKNSSNNNSKMDSPKPHVGEMELAEKTMDLTCFTPLLKTVENKEVPVPEDTLKNGILLPTSSTDAHQEAIINEEVQPFVTNALSCEAEDTTAPLFSKLARARSSVGIYRDRKLSSSDSSQSDNNSKLCASPMSTLPLITSPKASVLHEGSTINNVECSIRSPEKYTDCMLSSSLVDEEDNETSLPSNDLEGEEMETNEEENIFRTLGTEECNLFEESPVLETSNLANMDEADGKDSSADNHIDMHPEEQITNIETSDNKNPVEQEENASNQSSLPEQSREQVVLLEESSTGKSMIPENFAMLTSMTESILFQKDLPDTIGIKEFLQNYTDVRIGTLSSRRRWSSIAPPALNEKPQTFGELCTAVFVQARSIPVYKQFIESIHLKLKGLSEEVESLEEQILAKNTDVMRNIRFGSEEESEHLRSEVEELASRCKQLAKGEWKQNKGKLKKALARVKEETCKSDLEPVAAKVKECGVVEDLMVTAIAHLESAIGESESELQLLQSQGDLPTSEQIEKFQRLELEIDQARQEIGRRKERNASWEKTQKEWREKMNGIWEELERRRKEEEESEEKSRAAQAQVEALKKCLLWEILSDQPKQAVFGFLANSFVVTVKYSNQTKDIESYVVEERTPDVKLTKRQSTTHRFVLRILAKIVTSDELLKLGTSRESLKKALNFASLHVSRAKRLFRDIVSTAAKRFANVGVAFKENSILCEFDGDAPQLCSFIIEFSFVDEDGLVSLRPNSHHFVDSPTCHGLYDQAAISEALERVPQTAVLRFSKLVESVLSNINTKR